MSNILIVVSLLLATAVGAQESNSPTPELREVRTEGGTSVTPPTELPVKVQPAVDTNQAETSETAPAPVQKEVPPKSEYSQSAKDGQKTPVTQKASSASGNAVASKIGFVDILPWCLTIFMAVLTGATGTYIIILKKQERHFAELREKVLSGTMPVHLLPKEATRLIHEFHDNVKKGATHFDETVKHQRKELERIIRIAEETSLASHEQTKRTVDTFKVSLNEMLGKISKFMERVVQDTKETHNQALETKEFAKQVSSLIHDKEVEISKLKEGYHLHLISPLTKAFFKIRDDIHSLANHTDDPQIRQQLSDLDQRIGNALSDLQIEEIRIQVGEKPHEIHHSSLWESLGAAIPTDDPVRHGTIARVEERGYQLKIKNGEPHIIRKAVVVIHSCSSLNGQPEEKPIPQIQ